MTDPERTPPPPPELEKEKRAAGTSEQTLKEPEKKLTREQQMALYEEDLKETDWGHQPC